MSVVCVELSFICFVDDITVVSVVKLCVMHVVSGENVLRHLMVKSRKENEFVIVVVVVLKVVFSLLEIRLNTHTYIYIYIIPY